MTPEQATTNMFRQIYADNPEMLANVENAMSDERETRIDELTEKYMFNTVAIEEALELEDSELLMILPMIISVHFGALKAIDDHPEVNDTGVSAINAMEWIGRLLKCDLRRVATADELEENPHISQQDQKEAAYIQRHSD